MISNSSPDSITITMHKTTISKVFDVFRLVKNILHLQFKQLKTGLLIICAFFVLYVLFFSLLYP